MELIAPTICAFLITLTLTPLTIIFAKKYGLVDDPNKRPHPAHLHTEIIPRAGGLPCFISIFISTLIFLPFEKYLLGILSGLIILLILGLLDDKHKNFSPFARLPLQFLAAATVVAFGVGVNYITNPFGGIIRFDEVIIPINFLGHHNLVLVADILALFFIVWMMNMVNFSHGVDGQTPGFVTVTGVIIGLYSLKLYQAGDPIQLKIALLSFIMAGSSLGFLPFNWHPAKIFLGFSGTTIFGFLIAVLAILSGAKLAIALLVLMVPAIDSIYTIVRRILSGKLPFYADRKHLHHLLLERGWSHEQIALFYILTCVILGAIALNLNSQGKFFAALLVGTIIIGFILWLNFFGDFSKQSDPDNG